jgi:hypothetical protein
MPKPNEGSFPEYFSRYINKVAEEDLSPAFNAQQEMINRFFQDIPAEKHEYAYADGKWTLKEMIQHIIDAERIFCYRALCIARGEKQSLPGFEEDDYAANSHANGRSWDSLCEEMVTVRKSTIQLFESFNENDLERSGISNNKAVNPNALGFIAIGHVYHHVEVVKERYLER